MAEAFENIGGDFSDEATRPRDLGSATEREVSLSCRKPPNIGAASSHARNPSRDSKWGLMRSDEPASRGALEVTLQLYDMVARRRGLMLVFIADLFFSGKNLCLSYLSHEVSSFQAIVMIMPVMLLGSLLLLLTKRPPFPRQFCQHLWLCLGGIAAALVHSLLTISLPYLDLADAITISFTFLTFVGFFNWIFMRDPLRLCDFLFCILAFSGIVFIARPHLFFGEDGLQVDDENRNILIGVSFSFASAIFMALSIVFFRKQSQLDVSQYVTISCCACYIAVINAIACFALGQWKSARAQEWLISMAGGVSFLVAQWLLVVALRLQSATMVSIFLTFEIVYTFIWQWLLYEVSPLWTSYVGAFLLTMAGIGITLYNRKNSESERADSENTKTDTPEDNQEPEEMSDTFA